MEDVVHASGEVGKVQNKLFSVKDGMILRASSTSLALNECLLISLLILLEFLLKIYWISSWWAILTRILHLARYGLPLTEAWNISAITTTPEWTCHKRALEGVPKEIILMGKNDLLFVSNNEILNQQK